MQNKYLRFALIGVAVVLLGIFALNKAKNGEPADATAQTVSQTQQTAQTEVTSISDEAAQSRAEKEVAAIADYVAPIITEAKDAMGEAVTQTATAATHVAETISQDANAARILEKGEYNSKEDVALYIHTFSHLPANYITKKEAQALGWTGGGLDSYAKGKSIGGDTFGNREGLLPKQKGRTYTECDIDTRGKKSRGAKRIVFSNDGLIYYTGDHYENFDLLYDKDGAK